MIRNIRASLAAISKQNKERISKLILAVILILGLALVYVLTNQPETYRSEVYENFVNEYNKKYSRDQQIYRKFVFYQSYDDLIFNNKQLDQSYYEGVNEFSDLTEEEFQELYLLTITIAKNKKLSEIADFEDDYYYDWSYLMTQVKHQKDYQIGHIFATVAVLEFEVNKKRTIEARNKSTNLTPKFISLSQQHIINCCPNCRQNRFPKYVYTYLLNSGTIEEKYEPYINSIENQNPGVCKIVDNESKYLIKDYYQISNCRDLKNKIETGPVVVGVDARTWKTYVGGVLQNCNNQRNHYAVLVGKGLGFWKIRNSWGSRWGEKGHIRIKSGSTCGICGKASYPILQ